MSPHVTTTVVAFKTATLLLGGLITLLAYRAYERTGAAELRALAIGFGIVTLGSLAAGISDQFLGVNQSVSLLIESGLTAVGFAVIVYSLYAD